MKLLITGGYGFIGSNFIRFILRRHPDWQIVNIDALTYAGNLTNLADISDNPNYRFIHGRIEVPGTALEAMAGCDAVINFAAETHVDRSIVAPAPFVRTNVFGTQVLLDAAQRLKINRFIHISTDEVYGTLGMTGLFSEDMPLAPRSPYAASKAAADLLALAAFHTHQLPVSIVRPSNNYGPFQFPEKLIPLAITNLIENKKIPVYGRGENIRDWIYVDDTAQAIETVLLKGKPGEIYNAGGNNQRRNLEVVKRIVALLGKKEDSIEFVPDRPGHDFRYALNNKKIEQLGWNPQVDFETGLDLTVRWYVDNPAWWQPLKSRLGQESRGFWT